MKYATRREFLKSLPKYAVAFAVAARGIEWVSYVGHEALAKEKSDEWKVCADKIFKEMEEENLGTYITSAMSDELRFIRGEGKSAEIYINRGKEKYDIHGILKDNRFEPDEDSNLPSTEYLNKTICKIAKKK